MQRSHQTNTWNLKREFTKWLLENGADPNSGALLNGSISAITAAAMQNFLDLVQLLVQHGAKVSGTGALPAAAEHGHLAMVRYLLNEGAEIDEVGVYDYGTTRPNKNLGTALQKALAREDQGMVDLLRNRGARMDVAVSSIDITWGGKKASSGDGIRTIVLGEVEWSNQLFR